MTAAQSWPRGASSDLFIFNMLASLPLQHDSLAEWSKALAQGASPQGRGLEPHSCHVGCTVQLSCASHRLTISRRTSLVPSRPQREVPRGHRLGVIRQRPLVALISELC